MCIAFVLESTSSGRWSQSASITGTIASFGVKMPFQIALKASRSPGKPIAGATAS
jgi:hypothetical protein